MRHEARDRLHGPLPAAAPPCLVLQRHAGCRGYVYDESNCYVIIRLDMCIYMYIALFFFLASWNAGLVGKAQLACVFPAPDIGKVRGTEYTV